MIYTVPHGSSYLRDEMDLLSGSEISVSDPSVITLIGILTKASSDWSSRRKEIRLTVTT